MPPHSKSDMGCEQSTKFDQDILEISEKIEKIDILSKTEDEQSTYNIYDDNDDDEEDEEKEDAERNKTDKNIDSTATDTNDLSICAKIKEKGPVKHETNNNNRLNPYLRNTTSGGHLYYNTNNILNDLFDENAIVPLNFNGFAERREFSTLNEVRFEDVRNFLLDADTNATNNEFNDNNIALINNNDYLYDDQLFLNENESSSSYEASASILHLLTNNPHIPATIEQNNLPQTSTNRAEQTLSNYIDQNKKLKQIIWINVNTQVEKDLISKLREKIASGRFTQTEMNFIYAIIFRLMKSESNDDGKRLLLDYFLSDVDILFKIAIKGNFLLLDYILEVYQNLGINPNEFNVLHQIVDYSHVDLAAILDGLLNKMFDNKPSLNMFDVNCVDVAGQTVLMVLLRNISMKKGCHDVNMKYLDVILRRIPNITCCCVAQNVRNIFHYVINCEYSEDIIQKFLNYYDPALIESLLNEIYLNRWDYIQN